MRIKLMLSRLRNDFTAMLECEHCKSEQHLKTGYDDENYHNNVIPKIHCKVCGRNRAGNSQVIEKINQLGLDMCASYALARVQKSELAPLLDKHIDLLKEIKEALQNESAKTN